MLAVKYLGVVSCRIAVLDSAEVGRRKGGSRT